MKKLNNFFWGSIFCLITTFSAADPVFKNINGEDIYFSSLQGKWIFINYWASWCDSCIAEIPELNKFFKTHKKNVVLYGVNYDSLSVAQQIKFIKKYNIKYPNLSSSPAKLLKLGQISVVPVTFVINPDGKLVDTLFGPQTRKSLIQIMHKYQNLLPGTR